MTISGLSRWLPLIDILGCAQMIIDVSSMPRFKALRTFFVPASTAFDDLKDIKPSKKQKAELLDKVILYFVLHLQQFKPPKSTEILNEIFKTP